MKEKKKSRLAAQILCVILAGAMLLSGAIYIIYAIAGVL